jgi:HTH-type transcriptional regulator/antitoxin HipB
MKAVINSAADLGKLIRQIRLKQNLKQIDLATASGTGERFIVDLERGKATCEFDKVVHVANMLGIKLEANLPGPGHE